MTIRNPTPAVGFSPLDHGLIACDADPIISSSNYILASAGVVYLRKLKLAATSAISNVVLYVNAGGSVLSNAYVAVFDEAGTRLGVSADVSTSLQNTGNKFLALTTPTQVVAAGTWVYGGILVGAATTLPTFRAFPQAIHGFALSSGPQYRWGSSGSGLSAMPSSFAPSGVAQGVGAAPMIGLN